MSSQASRRSAARRALSNPTRGQRPSLAGGMAGLLNWQQNGEPWFNWYQVPQMLRDPSVLFGMDVKTAPLSRIEVKSVKAPRRDMAKWLMKTTKAFWERDLPLLVADYLAWGRMVGGVEWEWDADTCRLELKQVRRIEPMSAQPRTWRAGPHKGEFAGYTMSQWTGNSSTSNYVGSPNAFWFAGRQRLSQFVDMPAVSGAFTPWLEKNSAGGARPSRRLFFWRNAVGITVVYYPEGKSKKFGQMVNNEDAARQMGEIIANGSSVAMPSTPASDKNNDKAWSIEQRDSKADNSGLLEYVKELDGEIWMGLGIPVEVVRAMESGSGYDGRSIPNELHLAQNDTLAGMIFRAFKTQVLDHGAEINFGTKRYEVELVNLVRQFRQEHNAPKPDGSQDPEQGGGAGGGGGGGGQPRQPGQPYTGPRGGHGVMGANGKPRYGKSGGSANLSDFGDRVIAAGSKATPKEVTARRLATLAILQLREKAISEGDQQKYRDLEDTIAELADDPEELAKALGSVSLAWVSYGTSRSGKPRWRDDANGQLRYQASKPGGAAEKNGKGEASAKEASRIVQAHKNGDATADDLRKLVDHISALPVAKLRSARAMIGASFKSATKRDAMASALIDHVGGWGTAMTAAVGLVNRIAAGKKVEPAELDSLPKYLADIPTKHLKTLTETAGAKPDGDTRADYTHAILDKAQQAKRVRSGLVMLPKEEAKPINFVPHPSQNISPERYTTFMVDPDKLDSAWKADEPDRYIPPGGGGSEITGRRAGVDEFLKTGEPLEASKVVMGDDGKIAFEDGRHRFAVLRDRKLKAVPVTVPKAEADKIRAKLGATESDSVSLSGQRVPVEIVELELADESVSLAALHAPKGGATVAGKAFAGGEFVPADVAAKATPAERSKLVGKGGGKAKTEAKTNPAVKPAGGKGGEAGGKGGEAAGAVGPRTFVTPEQHGSMLKKVMEKFKAAPVPTEEERAVAEEKVAELGANKYRRNLVGNTNDRATRRAKLYAEFGDPVKRVCPCVYCGVLIGDGVGEGTLEQDKMYTTAMGGKYRAPNLVPSCSPCNKVRGDKPFPEAIKQVVQYGREHSAG